MSRSPLRSWHTSERASVKAGAFHNDDFGGVVAFVSQVEPSQAEAWVIGGKPADAYVPTRLAIRSSYISGVYPHASVGVRGLIESYYPSQRGEQRFGWAIREG